MLIEISYDGLDPATTAKTSKKTAHYVYSSLISSQVTWCMKLECETLNRHIELSSPGLNSACGEKSRKKPRITSTVR